ASNKERRSQLSGKLNLCDLAGSERLSRSNATGERLKETQAINKSLSALTDVFVAIANKQAHVPYRNSKLTYLLQQCLSGDGKTLMMINLSPTEQSYFESLCTLRFASQVNKCELGQARRNLHMVGQDGSSFASAGGPGATT
ncbi:dna topoisomerase, partial [Nannochloropsis gaditana CCMP526]